MACETGRPNACEATVVREVQMKSAVQLHGIESAFPGTDPESVGFYGSNDRERSVALCAAPHWAILITELSRNGGGCYPRKSFKWLYCDIFDVRTVRCKLESVTSCSKQGRENTGQICQIQEI